MSSSRRFRQVLPQQRSAQAGEGGLHHALHAQIGQYLRNIIQKQRVGRENHQLLRAEGLAVRVQQPRDAMQGDGGFAAARHALHDQRRLHGMADHEVLLCLNGRDDLSKLVRGDLPQHALQIRVLTDYAAVEQTQQLPVMDGEHPLEGHFTFHRAVRCGVGHGADLPRIIQVRHGGAPVHHHRVKAGAGHHAPASQIVRFLRTARRNEVQPRKIGLMRGLAQLAQDIQLHAENVQRYQLVRARVLRH